MSISTCPQSSGRLLALWLFAKHQQVQPPAFSLKKRPDPNTCLPQLAPVCRLNRLGRLRRTPGQMPLNRKRPLRLPRPPSQNQPRNPRPLRLRQILQRSLQPLQPGQNPSPHPSNICARPSRSLSCPRKPSLCPNLCPPSQPKPPSRLKVSRSQRTVPDRPRMTSRTYPPQIQPWSTSLSLDKTYTSMLFAA